jgi:hypothetical protein
MATVAADHLGHVKRSVLTKDGIERAIHIVSAIVFTRIGLQTTPYCNLRSLGLENASNTISRRCYLAKLYKIPEVHPFIPLVEMIYSRDSTVYYFDSNDASLLYGTGQSRMGVRQGDPLGPLLFNLALSLPAEFGRLNVPSLELDVELVHCALFIAILANLITYYESNR